MTIKNNLKYAPLPTKNANLSVNIVYESLGKMMVSFHYDNAIVEWGKSSVFSTVPLRRIVMNIQASDSHLIPLLQSVSNFSILSK